MKVSFFYILALSILSLFTSVRAEQVEQVEQNIPSMESLKKIDCPQLPSLVKAYDDAFVGKMKQWSNIYLKQADYQTAFYPFSGPDAVTVMSIYPKANYYVLVADQLPEFQDLEYPSKKVAKSESFECQMLTQYAHKGYFLTNDLIGKNGPRPRFIKLLIYNLAFAQAQIKEIKMVTVTDDGKILPVKDRSAADGVRFELITKDGHPATLDYIYANISDAGLEKNEKYQKAFARKSSDVVLVKSASHLLQNTYFSKMKNILISKAKWITQDETGIDIVPLSENFDIQLFGKFIKPNNLWANSPSAIRLANYYEKHPKTENLPFYLGYNKLGGSMLMVAKRK